MSLQLKNIWTRILTPFPLISDLRQLFGLDSEDQDNIGSQLFLVSVLSRMRRNHEICFRSLSGKPAHILKSLLVLYGGKMSWKLDAVIWGAETKSCDDKKNIFNNR